MLALLAIFAMSLAQTLAAPVMVTAGCNQALHSEAATPSTANHHAGSHCTGSHHSRSLDCCVASGCSPLSPVLLPIADHARRAPLQKTVYRGALQDLPDSLMTVPDLPPPRYAV